MGLQVFEDDSGRRRHLRGGRPGRFAPRRRLPADRARR